MTIQSITFTYYTYYGSINIECLLLLLIYLNYLISKDRPNCTCVWAFKSLLSCGDHVFLHVLITHNSAQWQQVTMQNTQCLSWCFDCSWEFFICLLLLNLFYMYILCSQLDFQFLQAREGGASAPTEPLPHRHSINKVLDLLIPLSSARGSTKL